MIDVLEGLSAIMDLTTLLYIFLGAMMGLLFGIIPGLGGTTVLALLIPLTFGMDKAQAVAMLISASGAVAFGGSMSAILLNTPGTAENIATTFDGFPLAKQGKAGVAIGASATASALGAIFGAIVLFMLIPVARNIVLMFSYPDYFLMAVLGIVVVVVASKSSLLKGLIAGGIGLLISFIGYDQTGFVRFTFDIDYLWGGVSVISIVIGVFAISEAIELFLKGGTISSDKDTMKIQGVGEGILSVFKNFGLFLKSALIGTVIGIIPGVGGTVANFVAYLRAKASVKDNSMFGKGDIRGVIAPESSNNAKDGGSLVPTVAFGIPGSGTMAVLLGALILHGLESGPQLMVKNASVLYTLVFALVLANIIVAVVGLLMVKQLVKVTLVPTNILAPSIIAISVMGALAVNGYFSDVLIAVIFGVIGYFMKKFDYSRVALIIAIVLGPMAENTFFQTYHALGLSVFYTRPLSIFLIAILIFVLLIPFFSKMKRKRGASV